MEERTILLDLHKIGLELSKVRKEDETMVSDNGNLEISNWI